MTRRRLTIDYRMSRSSGIGVYLRHMVQGLLERHDDAFRLVLLGGEPVAGTEHVPMRARIFSARELLEVPMRIPRNSDLVWSPNYNAPLISPGRLVVTIHDTCHLAMAELFGGIVKQKYARFMFDNVRRRASHVVCDSEFTMGEVERRVGIERSRLTLIYPGMSDDWLSAAPLPEGARPYLLFVGNVKPHKNLSRLLQAFGRMISRISHDLVIVGKREGFITPDRDVIGAAEALGDRVRFTGHVSDEAMREYYAGADLLVFPSLYEGFGYPPLEAMATGVPVAASRVASIPEVCGPAAFYFDPYSLDDMAATIELALRDEGRRAAMRAAGPAVVRRYSWPAAVDAVANIFHMVSRA